MLNQLIEMINKEVTSASAKLLPQEVGTSSIEISPASLRDVVHFVKTNNELSFNALQVISGVDNNDHFELNYMFCNLDPEHPRDVMFKTRLNDRDNASIDTICDLYPAANFLERECYDMFGMTFNNHPDHRRILCPDDWEGFPLRKDYEVAKVYNGMEINPDSKMNWDDREFAERQKKIKSEQTAQATE